MLTIRLSSARSVGFPRRSIIGAANCPRGVASSCIALTDRKSAKIRRQRYALSEATPVTSSMASRVGARRDSRVVASLVPVRTGGSPAAAQSRPHCVPWLIRRFIDPEARFRFAPTERVFAVAADTEATAYYIPDADPFSHDGELCSFDAFLKQYEIEDLALNALALIVRGADTARLDLTPQSPGLLAISLGLSAIYADDHAMLERGMIVYDALYAWCRDCRDQRHDWNPAALATRV